MARRSRSFRSRMQASRRALAPVSAAPSRPVVRYVASAPRTVVRYVRSGAGRARSALVAQRGRSLAAGGSWKKIFTDTALNSAGGIASTLFDGVTQITETKADDSLLFRVGVKGGVGVVAKYLFANSSGIREFVGGWNGHSSGAAINELIASKLGKK